MASSVTPLDREKAAIDKIMTEYRTPWAEARKPWVAQYLVNHAFLAGLHYVKFNGTHLEPLQRDPRYRNVIRRVNNLLEPAARAMLGLLTKNKPQIELEALTTEFVDEARKKVGKGLLRQINRITRYGLTRQHLWLDMFKGGTAGLRVQWKEDGGPPEEIPATNDDGEEIFYDKLDKVERTASEVTNIAERELSRDEGFQLESRFEIITIPSFPGEVYVGNYSVLEFMTDAGVRDLGEAQKVITERAYPLEFIKDHFGKRAENVQPESDILLFDSVAGTRIMPGAAVPRAAGYDSGSDTMPRAVLRELMIKPTRHSPFTGDPAPFGLHLVWAGDTLLTDLDNPLPYAFTPETSDHDVDFDMFDYRWRPEPGFYGKPFFSDLIPSIRSIDRRLSQILESINAFLFPKMLAERRSNLSPGTPNDVAGEVLEYTGQPPSYLEPPSIRPYVFSTLEFEIQQFNDISMLHEVVRQGRVPENMRTAEGLMLLQEIDSLALNHAVELFEEKEGEVAQKILDRTKQFYGEERTIDYVGEKNRLEVLHFRRSEFFSHRWRVYVVPGSAMPDLKSAKMAKAFQTLQFAPWAVVDPTTRQPSPQILAQLLGENDFELFMEGQDESRQAAKYENAQLSEGIPIEVRPYEDHGTHLREHYLDIRSPDFREQPQEIQKIKLQHVSQHEQALAQHAQMSQRSAEMIQGQAKEAARDQVMIQSAASAAASEARDQVRSGDSRQGGGAMSDAAEQSSGEERVRRNLQQLLKQRGRL